MLAKLKSYVSTAIIPLSVIWDQIRGFVIAIGAIIVAIEFNKIKEYLLVKAGAKEISKAKSQDQSLANQEQSNEQKADTLVKQAEQLPGQENPVDVNWYKKDSK